jgi:sugar lactone lactonase YvrE
MKKFKSNFLLLSIVAIVFAACSKDDVKPLEQQYKLTENALFPEGIAYSSATQKIYAGSYYKGKIVSIDLMGQMRDFIIDDQLVAVVGIAVDTYNNRLIVSNSDSGLSEKSDNSTIGQLAQVIFYDLNSGVKLRTVDLSQLVLGGHFINDVTIDNAGNIYATDSFSSVIYKIDSEYNASVFLESDLFIPDPGTFGLNGIVYNSGGFLIVGKSIGGLLYKVPLDDPQSVIQITLDQSINALDGLLLKDASTLLVVSNNFTGAPYEEAVYKITSSDGWNNASVANSFTNLTGTFPTTLAMVNNAVYVNYGEFSHLIDGSGPNFNDFKLQKITF